MKNKVTVSLCSLSDFRKSRTCVIDASMHCFFVSFSSLLFHCRCMLDLTRQFLLKKKKDLVFPQFIHLTLTMIG